MTERKDEILQAAKDIFAERGVKNTTVRQIGARAGILSGSLYHHFESKLDMVDAILGDFCREVSTTYAEIAGGEGDAADRLRRMIRYAFSLVPAHTAAVQIMLNDAAELAKEPRFRYLAEFDSQVERCWVGVLQDGIDGATFRDSIDPVLVYRLARDAAIGAIRWYDDARGPSVEALSDECTDVFVTGIARRDT